jgi:hypothetical protein
VLRLALHDVSKGLERRTPLTAALSPDGAMEIRAVGPQYDSLGWSEHRERRPR